MAVEHYDFCSPETHADADVPHGPGYYRHAHAPPVDPLEQSRSILQQAADAGAPFIACAEFVSDLHWRATYATCNLCNMQPMQHATYAACNLCNMQHMPRARAHAHTHPCTMHHAQG